MAYKKRLVCLVSSNVGLLDNAVLIHEARDDRFVSAERLLYGVR